MANASRKTEEHACLLRHNYVKSRIEALIQAYRISLFMHMIVEELVLDWAIRFQTPNMGYSETVQ